MRHLKMLRRQNCLTKRFGFFCSCISTSGCKILIDIIQHAITSIADSIMRSTSAWRTERNIFTDHPLILLIIDNMLNRIPFFIQMVFIVIASIQKFQELITINMIPYRTDRMAFHIIVTKNDRSGIRSSFLRESTRFTHSGLRQDQRFTSRLAIQIVSRRSRNTINQNIALDQMRNCIAIDVSLQANCNCNLFKLTLTQVITRCKQRFQSIVLIFLKEINQLIRSDRQTLLNLSRLQSIRKFLMHNLLNTRITLCCLND